MPPKIVNNTSRGRITLLKSCIKEKVIFDADRDNNGEGVSPDEIIRMLKKNYKAR